MGLTPEQHAQTQKRVADNICAKCRKPFAPGHRIVPCWIVINPNARNPHRITESGLELGTDCEYAHIECKDPMLEGRRVLTLS